MTIKEILEQVDDEVVIEIMDELGSPVYGRGSTSSGSNYMMFRTICHDGDSHKLYYYSDTKTFYCYTNCGSMSIFDLIIKVKRLTHKDFGTVLRYVAKKAGITNLYDKSTVEETAETKTYKEDLVYCDKLIENRELLKLKPPDISKFYNKNILNYFDKDSFYQGWIDEGITEDSMRKFGIRYYWAESHIIIPHYDIDGNLVGIRRRSLNPDDSNCKYMPEYINGIQYEHPLGLNLYGLYENQEAIKRLKTAVIVEGEKSVLLSDSYFGDDSVAVATCGFNVSDWQIKALAKLGVERVYLGLDNDYDWRNEDFYKLDPVKNYGYNHYKKRIQTLALRMYDSFDVRIIEDKRGLLKLKDSPFDRGKETVEKLILSAHLPMEV